MDGVNLKMRQFENLKMKPLIRMIVTEVMKSRVLISKFPNFQILKLLQGVCFICWSIGILASCSPSAKMTPDEREIRLVREASNAAIAAHDTTAMAKTLSVDYNVVTSRNAVSVGRSAMLQRFAADAPDVIYIRTSEVIRVFPEWKMASETGTWVGRWKDGSDSIELSGTYFAKWHKVDGQWVIRAEIFTPLRCLGGQFCDRSPI